MTKRYTMPDGKTRAASQGQWIFGEDVKAFLEFCQDNGHETRKHPGLCSTGYQVRHAGHWMGLLWNKSFRRYTADRRLSLLVQSFAATGKTPNDQHKGPAARPVPLDAPVRPGAGA